MLGAAVDAQVHVFRSVSVGGFDHPAVLFVFEPCCIDVVAVEGRGVGDVLCDEGSLAFRDDFLCPGRMQDGENALVVRDRSREIAKNACQAGAHRPDECLRFVPMRKKVA